MTFRARVVKDVTFTTDNSTAPSTAAKKTPRRLFDQLAGPRHTRAPYVGRKTGHQSIKPGARPDEAYTPADIAEPRCTIRYINHSGIFQQSNGGGTQGVAGGHSNGCIAVCFVRVSGQFTADEQWPHTARINTLPSLGTSTVCTACCSVLSLEAEHCYRPMSTNVNLYQSTVDLTRVQTTVACSGMKRIDKTG